IELSLSLADNSGLCLLDSCKNKYIIPKRKFVFPLVTSLSALVIFLLVSCGIWIYKTKKLKERKGLNQKKLLHEIGDIAIPLTVSGKGKFSETDKTGQEIHIFSFESIVLATDNFSSTNKLGEGGFGLVYKAWKLWNEERALQLVDPLLSGTSSAVEILRCIHIGLLCVQDHAKDRPDTLDVVSFLSNETIPLAEPKQPAFFMNAIECKATSPNDIVENCSIYNVTVSDMNAIPNAEKFSRRKKDCYSLKPKQGKRNNYLREELPLYIYGNYDGKNQTPTFDLYLGVNHWALVYPYRYHIAEIIDTSTTDTIHHVHGVLHPSSSVFKFAGVGVQITGVCCCKKSVQVNLLAPCSGFTVDSFFSLFRRHLGDGEWSSSFFPSVGSPPLRVLLWV
ncbi:probable leucine-rich repeat receptor-like protein kinase At2g28990, partial [Prosopis cineraria]|uniref:probable leucine-rich repeat receptor-like protein kinase At2g28990 n=1 Tax=Prosopis cineraria TaxID=364024 RepID=UPI00240FD037